MLAVPEFLSLVVDPVRLAVLGSAVRGPVDVAEVAVDLGVNERRVQRELGRLVAAGLVDREHRAVTEALRELARALPSEAPIDPTLLDGSWTDEEATILSRFFAGRRLVRVPGVRAKRLLVLERLALEFEPGVRYEEREVDFTLQMFYPDYASLRRLLVDEGLMTRADGVYWRTGGRTMAPVDSEEGGHHV